MTGNVRVSCWCERSYVSIPVKDVGWRTGSCGRPDCEPKETRSAR